MSSIRSSIYVYYLYIYMYLYTDTYNWRQSKLYISPKHLIIGGDFKVKVSEKRLNKFIEHFSKKLYMSIRKTLFKKPFNKECTRMNFNAILSAKHPFSVRSTVFHFLKKISVCWFFLVQQFVNNKIKLLIINN